MTHLQAKYVNSRKEGRMEGRKEGERKKGKKKREKEGRGGSWEGRKGRKGGNNKWLTNK